MGTRSTIAIEFADGSISQVYCHFDGYLEHNGKILVEHYIDPFKVRALVDLGGFGSLRETIDATAEGAYTTRGEELAVERYMNRDEYFDCCSQEEYDYLLTESMGWLVRCYATRDQWIPVNEAEARVEQMENEEA